MKIAFLFTCFNRIEKTGRCIASIQKALVYAKEKLKAETGTGVEVEDQWFIVDAGSSDGTPDKIRGMIFESKIHMCVVENAFYSQGMRVCMDMAEKADECDLYMMINDDVEFYEDFLVRILAEYAGGNAGIGESAEDYHGKEAAGGNNHIAAGVLSGSEVNSMGAARKVVVGATDDGIKQTYGGVRYDSEIGKRHFLIPRSIHYRMVDINDANRKCHTFNANCVVITSVIFKNMGSIDSRYVHGLGDFDCGMCIYEKFGNVIETSSFYVGKCFNNPKEGSWMDRTLPRGTRIRKLNNPKGSPTGIWFHYLNKHFGFATAVCYSISPYVRILLGK